MKKIIAAGAAFVLLSAAAYAADMEFPKIDVGEDSEGNTLVTLENTYEYPILKKSSYYDDSGSPIWYARYSLLQGEKSSYKTEKSTKASEENIKSRTMALY